MNRPRLYLLSVTAAMLIGGLLFGQGIYIYAKAQLAQVLLKSAWQETQLTQHETKPWPWADTWPVARMLVPAHGIDLIILAGDTGRTLAFGPGHRPGTANPGAAGNSIISAHRDTHFKFIKDLAAGDEIVIENQLGVRKHFIVNTADIIDARTTKLAVDYEEAVLTLVTCYPFDALIPGGPLRYVVFATQTQDFVNGVLI